MCIRDRYWQPPGISNAATQYQAPFRSSCITRKFRESPLVSEVVCKRIALRLHFVIRFVSLRCVKCYSSSKIDGCVCGRPFTSGSRFSIAGKLGAAIKRGFDEANSCNRIVLTSSCPTEFWLAAQMKYAHKKSGMVAAITMARKRKDSDQATSDRRSR